MTRSGEPIGRGLHASRPRIRNREFVAQLLVVYDYRGEDTGNDGCIMHAGRGWGEFLQRSASFIPSWAVLYKTVCCVGGDLLHEPIRVDIWIVIVARTAFDVLSEVQSRRHDDAITFFSRRTRTREVFGSRSHSNPRVAQGCPRMV